MNAINWLKNETEITEENISATNPWLQEWAETMEAYEAELAELDAQNKAQAEAKAQATTGTKIYYPEMKEERPEALIDARLSHYGKHYFLRVHPSIPTLKGRGIKVRDNSVVAGSRFEGWNAYKVTIKAYEKIEAEHVISYEMLLD